MTTRIAAESCIGVVAAHMRPTTVQHEVRAFCQLFAWLGNYRRLVVRHEHNIDNFLGFVHLGCILILLSYL